MTVYRTPGVYVREVQLIPPAVAAVATAIPCFFGYTADATLAGTPTRITSLLEFEEKFGASPVTRIDLDVVKRVTQSGALLGVDVSLNEISVGGGAAITTGVPTELLHYSVRHFYACGGGPCWIYSLGAHGSNTAADYTDAITALEAVDEPTLLVFPGATGLATHEAVIQHALSSALRSQDRFVIADVREAHPGGANADSNAVDTLGTGFRASVAPVDPKALQYGAAYWPYLNTQIPWFTTEDSVRIVSFTRREIQNDGSAPVDTTPLTVPIAISDATVRDGETSAYNACKTFAQNRFVTLPPSGAVAGVYATVDRNRGVWKAPANVGLALVSSAAIRATNDDNDRLNVDTTSGKSINVIRAFAGKGVLVWGARTLAGNDNEYRYVNVRRLTIMIEESVEKAVGTFVFESNDKNTWVKVKTMIENFLFLQWRAGALQGAKPEDAYHVLVGLGTTMTPDDILNGYMRVSVFIAPVRPAEFIELTFMQKLPSS